MIIIIIITSRLGSTFGTEPCHGVGHVGAARRRRDEGQLEEGRERQVRGPERQGRGPRRLVQGQGRQGQGG
eukprot:6984007-Lingulodinium_polyedra.AAC.1